MDILLLLIIILVVLWLGGFALHIAGGAIHLLLIVALVVFIWRLLQPRAR